MGQCGEVLDRNKSVQSNMVKGKDRKIEAEESKKPL